VSVVWLIGIGVSMAVSFWWRRCDMEIARWRGDAIQL
jgi:hypothetical protein